MLQVGKEQCLFQYNEQQFPSILCNDQILDANGISRFSLNQPCPLLVLLRTPSSLRNCRVQLGLLQAHRHLWKSNGCRNACFKDTVIFEKETSAATLVSRTQSSSKKCRVPLRLFQGPLSSLKKCRVPLRLIQGHSRFETVQRRCDKCFFAIFAPSHGPIGMKISVNVQNLILNITYFMLHCFKMQWEAKKGV